MWSFQYSLEREPKKGECHWGERKTEAWGKSESGNKRRSFWLGVESEAWQEKGLRTAAVFKRPYLAVGTMKGMLRDVCYQLDLL